MSRRIQPTASVDATSLSLLLDEKQAAKFLGVSLSYLRKSRSEGAPGDRTPAPPFVRLDGRVKYKLATLKAWVDELEERRVS